MAAFGQILELDDLHPIDMVESIAALRNWDFERVADDQIAVIIEGGWQNYSLSLVWDEREECLQLVCAFEMDPDDDLLPKIYETLNHVNEEMWLGGFSLWRDRQMMVYRYVLDLSGGVEATPHQVDRMVEAGILACEKYYPVFQLVGWADEMPEQAMQMAFPTVAGRA